MPPKSSRAGRRGRVGRRLPLGPITATPMATQLTVDDARQSLNAHVAAKGAEIREKYGPHIGWHRLTQILHDRSFVRYPCEIVFNAGPLASGEFAYPAPNGDKPDDGFTLHIH